MAFGLLPLATSTVQVGELVFDAWQLRLRAQRGRELVARQRRAVLTGECLELGDRLVEPGCRRVAERQRRLEVDDRLCIREQTPRVLACPPEELRRTRRMP